MTLFKRVFLAAGAALIVSTSWSSATAEEWTPPTIIPRPVFVAGVEEPVRSLGGTWLFTTEPPDDLSFVGEPGAGWRPVTVPGEPWMQGFRIERDVEYPYWRRFDVPGEAEGKRVFLVFHGVYSKARVWVNGQFAGSHHGGYTTWNLEITQFVNAGEEAQVVVGVIDPSDDPSFGSRYASRYLGATDLMHPTLGISREVELMIVPRQHLTSLHYVTDFDEKYQNAELSVQVAADLSGTETAEVRFILGRPDSRLSGYCMWDYRTPLPTVLELTAAEPAGEIREWRNYPQKWDAEHPNLYTLIAELLVDGIVLERVSREVGFREIEIDGAVFKVNGKPVKLRGGCRHSAHPLAGRAEVPGIDERDVLLYKEANINYIRTSHYPTTERFLELADQYGLYIEEEMAICWAGHHAAGVDLQEFADDPSVRGYFMDAIAETLTRDGSHPSIILWSLGNENTKWGENFEAERDYARRVDPTRPLKTGHNHYQGGWDTNEHTDIDSMHYPAWNTDFTQVGGGKPYLADEYAHVRCYFGPGSRADLDPNVRNAWGESLKLFWDRIFAAEPVLGGAIWGTVDDVFYCPDEPVGYGRWGLFDGWRRKKPEHWLTKKAYSPIRIENAPVGMPEPGRLLEVAVENRFDHTDLNELKIIWRVGEEEGRVYPNVPPRSKGRLFFPPRPWTDTDILELEFHSIRFEPHHLVDRFELPLVEREIVRPEPAGPAPEVTFEEGGIVAVTGNDFVVRIDSTSGQIIEASVRDERLLVGGPRLQLAPSSSAFTSVRFSYERVEDHVKVWIAGMEGAVPVIFEIRIDGAGLLEVIYKLSLPSEDRPSLTEVGVWFEVDGGIDRLSWERNGLWSAYPDDHIGRLRGVAIRERDGLPAAYGKEPTWLWSHDMEDFHMHGKEHAGYGLSHDFRATKEQIVQATLYRDGSGARLRVESDGESQAVRVGFGAPYRFQVDDVDPRVFYSGDWEAYTDPQDVGGSERYSAEQGATASLTFSGSSIAWISCRNQNLGIADVLLDGERVAEGIDLYGPSKRYGQVLFLRDGLAEGEHTLEIVATGRKNEKSSHAYVLIDAFRDLRPPLDRPLRLHILDDWGYHAGWGNYARKVDPEKVTGGTVRLRLASDG